MEGGMPPSPSLNYLGASLTFFFHQELSLGEQSFATGMCVERAAKSNHYFYRGLFLSALSAERTLHRHRKTIMLSLFSGQEKSSPILINIVQSISGLQVL